MIFKLSRGNLSQVQIRIDTAQQLLMLSQKGCKTIFYSVSTAQMGAGELSGSYKTPRGKHIIRAKIGHGVALNGVFVGRRFTNEIYSKQLLEMFPDRDWILSRILWLSGVEVGRNRLGQVDTMRRYIYIHGTPDSEPMGVPRSHGCIRMTNKDIVDLFERVPLGASVEII